MNDYYLKTHNRASPWLIGAMLGYYLTRDSSKYAKIPKILSLLTWICSFGVILTCVFGGHSTLRTPYYDRLGNSFYIALVRPAWALAIGWIIWACCTNRGGVVNTILSYPIFQVLNKFTYSIYILHVTSLYMIVFSQKTSIYFTVFNLSETYSPNSLWTKWSMLKSMVTIHEKRDITKFNELQAFLKRKSKSYKPKKVCCFIS
ncbi:nose resistant to fluoxetine protein 6-like isoform X1 [Leptinotarsa decemlineata]|uniref:nose resistant to fluoxetine protein 6-like isoform X1 n=1 Tax=Leptinotarsa decemlineata TaxID=7539 RepID=UPI003D30C014